jgi:hypothetical protein
VISSIIIAGTILYTAEQKNEPRQKTVSVEGQEKTQTSALQEKVLPSEGVTLPAIWGDLGARLVDAGVIDAVKFRTIYEQKGLYTTEYKDLLEGNNNGALKITRNNSGYVLNLLWALGLANKNAILEKGEMADIKYGGAGRFASTGGWTLAKGDAMDHYSKHSFLTLTAPQQALVEKVSRGIYRPCCGNSTHFPDCNHGMAMLGLLELMGSQGANEQDMWKTALTIHSYWFPDNYLTIATYMQNKGVNWQDVDPKEMLGSDYSSSKGYAKISSEVAVPPGYQGGNGCGV